MQSKYKIFAGSLLVFSILFSFFLIFSPKEVNAVSVACSSECVANSCGSSIGTKQVPIYKKICDKGCPTVVFETERYVCPAGSYDKESKGHPGYCYKGSFPNWPRDYKPMVKQTFGPISVQYGTRSQDPNKCHRPNVNQLQVPTWARDDYNRELDEHLPFIDINCRDIKIGYETVECNDAPIIPCEQECPTQCGYEGGVVADGQGGDKVCPPTNSCSTYRWCFPTDSDESPTGYMAESISIDITPDIGKPWESGKMIDKYCGYTPAGSCPTQCGYAGGDEVADGQGGIIICQATAACEEDDDDDGDVMGEGDVLGTSTVVLADTAGEDTTLLYLIQYVLIMLTVGSVLSLANAYYNRR